MRTVVAIDPPDDPTITDAESLGAAIRSARTRSGIALVDAAEALGISRQTLINIEKGGAGVALPSVLKAAHELGVTLFAVPSGEREMVRRAIVAVRDEERVSVF